MALQHHAFSMYVIVFLVVIIILLIAAPYVNLDIREVEIEAVEEVEEEPGISSEDFVRFDEQVPIIWVGGVPRSGTTLMRAMLDAHRDIRCGEETHVIPFILNMHKSLLKSDSQMERLEDANIDEDVLNAAMGAYMLSIIELHGESAKNLCNKDPFTLSYTDMITDVFPNSKYILMIRDGRATAHSIISREVGIKGFDTKSYRGALEDWNDAISRMYTDCLHNFCLPVYYEQLVLHPEAQMRRILEFLDIPWDEKVLHHEEAIGKENGISLSKVELSTDQVNKAVNVDALVKWVPHIPDDVKEEMDSIAPMLRKLGYDPNANPPNYGTPDKSVLENSKTDEEKAAEMAAENSKEQSDEKFDLKAFNF